MSGRKEKAKRQESAILGLDGLPARSIEATEAEAPLPCDDIGYYRALVAEKYPHLDAKTQDEAARAMQGRYLLMQRAYAEGLRQGRTIREKIQYGKGYGWEELNPLTPKERTLVMERVRKAIGVES